MLKDAQESVSDKATSSSKKIIDIAEPHAQSTNNDESYALQEALSAQAMVPIKRPGALRRAASAVGKVSKNPQAFKWVLRDSKKFDKGLIQIANLVDYLQEMLSQDQMSKLIESTNNFKLMLLQLTSSVSEMKALLWADQIQERSSLDGTTLVGSDDSVSTHSNAATLRRTLNPTAFWQAATRFSINMREETESAVSAKRLNADDLSIGDNLDGDSRTLAQKLSTGVEVWIEWRQFETELTPTNNGRVEKRVPEKTLERVERLVALLCKADKPAEFCVPPCLGYFQDDSRQQFGLVFASPVESGSWPPRSLLSCFGTQGITLRTKIGVAQDLAQWLLYLHAVNWLHKGLRSASILFFSDASSKYLGRSFVSGFDYARIVHSDTIPMPAADDTERAMYIHPDYIGAKRRQGFKKTYDMYSLGIILIEIAFWRPINGIVGSAFPGPGPLSSGAQAVAGAERDDETNSRPVVGGSSTQASAPLTIGQVITFRERILKGAILEKIAETMGDAYADATRVCIEGMTGLGLSEEQDQTDVSVAALIQQSFIDKVVYVLKGISV